MKSFVLLIVSGLLFWGGESLMAMPGGFTDVSVTEQSVIDAAMFAVEAEQAILPADNASAQDRMTLLKILSARQQVVAGVNYELQLEVSVNGERKAADAVVWWQAWKEDAPYTLVSWHWLVVTGKSN